MWPWTGESGDVDVVLAWLWPGESGDVDVAMEDKKEVTSTSHGVCVAMAT
jgi:hypothetical protein